MRARTARFHDTLFSLLSSVPSGPPQSQLMFASLGHAVFVISPENHILHPFPSHSSSLSVQNAIRSGFDSAASGQVQTEMSEELRLDLTLQLARQIGGWRHLLSSSASGIPTSSSPSFSSSSSSSSTFITYQGVYAEARKHNLRLHRALEKLEEAERLLDEGGKDGGVVDRYVVRKGGGRAGRWMIVRPFWSIHLTPFNDRAIYTYTVKWPNAFTGSPLVRALMPAASSLPPSPSHSFPFFPTSPSPNRRRSHVPCLSTLLRGRV